MIKSINIYKLSRENANHIGWFEYSILKNSLTTNVNWENFMMAFVSCSHFKDKSVNNNKKKLRIRVVNMKITYVDLWNA